MNKNQFLCVILVLIFNFNYLNGQVIDLATGLHLPLNMTLVSSELYFDEDDNGKISNIDVSLSNSPVLHTANSFTEGLAVHNGYLYSSEFNGINKYNLNDSPPITPVSITPTSAGALAFNGNDLYYAYSSELFKIDVSASIPIETLVFSGLTNYVDDMTFSGDTLYLLNSSDGNQYTGRIDKIDITQSVLSLSNVITGLNFPRGIAINQNELYYSEDPSIKKIDLNTPTPTTVSTGLLNPFGLAFYEGELYFTQASDGSGKISKISNLNLSNDEIYNTDFKLTPNPANHYITIDASGINQYKIYNAVGENLMKGLTNSFEKIDITDLNSGLYFIQINSGQSQRFVKL